MFDFNDINEAYCEACKAQHEIQLRRRERYQVGEFSNRGVLYTTPNNSQQSVNRPRPPQALQKQPQGVQQWPLPPQNQRQQAPQNDPCARGRADKREVIYHTYQQKGHYARECPHRNLYADDETEDNEKYDEHIDMEKLADTQGLVNEEFPAVGVPLV